MRPTQSKYVWNECNGILNLRNAVCSVCVCYWCVRVWDDSPGVAQGVGTVRVPWLGERKAGIPQSNFCYDNTAIRYL